MSDANRTVVIDNGGGTIKIGFADDKEPRCILPAVLRPRTVEKPGSKEENYLFSETSHPGFGPPKYPIDHGIITNWDHMDQLWNHAFRETHLDLSESAVVFANHHTKDLSKAQAEQITQIMIESFEVPAFYLAKSTTLATYYASKPTAAVIDCGETVTDICCVYEHCGITRTVTPVNVAGRDLTYYLQSLIEGVHWPSDGWFPFVRDIKEKHAYVALDFDAEVKKAEKVDCESPWDNKFSIAEQRLRCPEILFKPSINGLQCEGIGQALFNAIMKCDGDIRGQMFSNIILSGGTTLCKGFPERIEKEIKSLAPQGTEVNVIALPDRHLAAWVGGSVLGRAEAFKEMTISRAEYDEEGACIVHRKCW